MPSTTWRPWSGAHDRSGNGLSRFCDSGHRRSPNRDVRTRGIQNRGHRDVGTAESGIAIPTLQIADIAIPDLRCLQTGAAPRTRNNTVQGTSRFRQGTLRFRTRNSTAYCFLIFSCGFESRNCRRGSSLGAGAVLNWCRRQIDNSVNPIGVCNLLVTANVRKWSGLIIYMMLVIYINYNSIKVFIAYFLQIYYLFILPYRAEL